MIAERSSRALLVAFVVGLPMAGVAMACTSGDPVAYAAAAVLGSDGGGDGGEGGPAADGSLLTVPGVSDGGFVPAIQHLSCNSLDPDGGCDPTAGMGCCLAGNSNSSGDNNTCLEQVQHYNSTACKDPNDVFLGCLGSDTDSTCCWQPEADGRHNTRFRADCDGGVEACDPSADGGSCSTGGSCHMTTCKGVVVGYCGGGPAPCQ